MLGDLGDPSLADDIKPFLEESRAPQVAGLALRVLCTDLRLSKLFEDEIYAFVVGMPWDEDDDAKLFAIQVAGEHLRQNANDKLTQLLQQVADGEGVVADAARKALLRAEGRSWQEVYDRLRSE